MLLAERHLVVWKHPESSGKQSAFVHVPAHCAPNVAFQKQARAMVEMHAHG